MSLIKTVLKNGLRGIASSMGETRVGGVILQAWVNAAMSRVAIATHGGKLFKFAAPNHLCKWRSATFSSKEPETLEWIDAMPEGAVLWDVGANVGLYSVYAASIRGCKVFAFEPSVFNLEMLARNAFLNGLVENIHIVPVALSNQTGSNRMKMTSMEWGGALSTFGESYGWDGKPLRQIFEYSAVGMRMDDVVASLNIPAPDYIKMDVDGIEHLILSGGQRVLAGVKGILIEVNEMFQQQSHQSAALLGQAGLIMLEKRQSEMIAGAGDGFQHSFNQIWARNK